MNKNIISLYKIDFYNLIKKDLLVDKIPNTSIGGLSFFLHELSLYQINEYILPSINEVLSEGSEEVEVGTETTFLIISLEEVIFLPDNQPQFSLPFDDFKQIVEGWRDFLLSPPLNGTKA